MYNHWSASRKQLVGKSVELLFIGNECFVLLLLFSRLNMDHICFIFSLLLIVSVTTITFGSAMKANNPKGEVKKRIDLCYCLPSNFMLATLKGVSLKISLVRFMPRMKLSFQHSHIKGKRAWAISFNKSRGFLESDSYAETCA